MRARGTWSRATQSWVRVQDLWVLGLGFRVSGLGCRIYGFGVFLKVHVNCLCSEVECNARTGQNAQEEKSNMLP